jgi:hypothetical protein
VGEDRMSDDLNKKIKQITDLLGQESVPDNLKGLLNLLASSGGKEDSAPTRVNSEKDEDAHPLKENSRSRNEIEENIDMVRKIKKVMDRVNSNNDPRVNLLTAVRPFLSSSRQKKLNNCIKLLHMTSMTRFLEDFDKDSF